MCTQSALAIKGAGSSACFFSRLAAFFSFGDSEACFFTSRLDRLCLVMVLTPDHIAEAPAERGLKALLKARGPGVWISPALL
jgi:hypothetical protein